MKMITESYKISDDVLNELRSILSEEYLANEMYRMAYFAMSGKKQHLLQDVSMENAKDEFDDHFTNLMNWMQSNGLEVVTSRDEMVKLAQCTLFHFKDGASTIEVLDSLILSEQEAISHYEDVLDMDGVKYDLHVMLAGFLKDEREHLKALMDIRAELSGTNIEDMEIELDDDEPEDELYDESVVINERELDMGEKLERVVEPEEVATVQWLYMSAMDAGRKTAIYELEDLLGDRANDKEIRDILDRMKDWIDSGAHSSRSQAISDGYARSARTGSNLGD